MAKYYKPPHGLAAQDLNIGAGGPGMPGLQTLKEQRAFEKSIWEKTRRGAGESLHELMSVLLRAVYLVYLCASPDTSGGEGSSNKVARNRAGLPAWAQLL